MASIIPISLEGYRRIVVLTGAGISAGSGLPTYRGVGGLWNETSVASYATAAALERDPERVWGFFAELREKVGGAQPNAGHLALAQVEQQLQSDQQLTVLTQNVDGLHALAGSTHVVELHGSLYRASCTNCDFASHKTWSHSPKAVPVAPTTMRASVTPVT